MSEWKITDNRVHGNGQSYPCNNRITAEQLQKTLNDYENIKTEHHETEQKLDKIQRILIQLQMTTQIQTHELETLKEALQ